MNKQLIDQKPRIFFTGVGGQGTLTATKLLAQTALAEGLEVVAGEVHGMAQRGGIVESAILIGEWRSPYLDLGEADIILGFEPLESLRSLPWLASGGVLFSALEPIPPLSVSLGTEPYPDLETIKQRIKEAAFKSFFIPCHTLGEKAGSRLAGTSALLGALCASGFIPLELEALENGIIAFLPSKIQTSNLTAARLGYTWFKENYPES